MYRLNLGYRISPRLYPVTQEKAGFNQFVAQCDLLIFSISHILENISIAQDILENISIAQDTLENMNTTQDALIGTGYNVYIHLL